VVVKGDFLMKGYWKLPAVTEQTIKGGYLYTGDMGEIDEEGFIYLSGRKKDVITTGGNVVFPREVEEVLYTHPAVREVAVVGTPDEGLGEAVVAFVILKPGQQVTAEEMVEFCRRSVAEYAVPRSVVFVPELPRNPTGKVLKRELKEKYG